MREIKFRAWHKDSREMLHAGVADIFIWQHEGRPIEIMQYTGLKDKNGKEIYEGDIVGYKQKPPHKHIAIDYYSQIIYKGNMFCLKPSWIRWNDGSFSFMSIHTEVIGNIYENPELLTKGGN